MVESIRLQSKENGEQVRIYREYEVLRQPLHTGRGKSNRKAPKPEEGLLYHADQVLGRMSNCFAKNRMRESEHRIINLMQCHRFQFLKWGGEGFCPDLVPR